MHRNARACDAVPFLEMARTHVKYATVAAGLLGSAAFIACTLLNPLDNFSNGGTEGGGPEYYTTDAAEDADADTDSADAQLSSSCSAHAFCDDFDDPPLGATWSFKDEPNGDLSLEDGGPS